MIFFAIGTDNPGKKYLERSVHSVQSQCNYVTRVLNECTDFKMKQNISKCDLSFPSPHHSMLGYFCRPLNALAHPTLKRGRGGDIFLLLRRKRSKTFCQDCLCRMQKISSKFGFSLITQKINVA